MRFGVSAIMGSFGSMKTFSEFLAMEWYSPDTTFVIANVPYDRVDWFYSTESDLREVFKVLDDWCIYTNTNIKKYWFERKKYKDIFVIVDEAHRYFDSRSSLIKWNNMESIHNVLTQCRKRNIRFVAITQRLPSIDIRIRRLSDYVEEYKRVSFLGLYGVRHTVYENRWDIADIQTDSTVRLATSDNVNNIKEDSKLYSEFYTPWTMFLQLSMLFNKSFRSISREYYNTYFICGLNDVNVDHFDLKSFDEALTVPKYRLYDNVINVEKSNFITRSRLFLNKTYNSLWSKVFSFLDTSNKGLNVKNNVYPIKTDFEETLINLKSSDESVITKKLSVSDLLKNSN